MVRDALVTTRMLCALRVVSVALPQWEAPKVRHRTALHMCLGLLSFLRNLATLSEAHDSSLLLLVEERSLRQLERMHRSR